MKQRKNPVSLINAMSRLKVINCKNRYFWYSDELRKPIKKRTVFAFDKAPDGKGVIVPKKGYIYNGDFKIIR